MSAEESVFYIDILKYKSAIQGKDKQTEEEMQSELKEDDRQLEKLDLELKTALDKSEKFTSRRLKLDAAADEQIQLRWNVLNKVLYFLGWTLGAAGSLLGGKGGEVSE